MPELGPSPAQSYLADAMALVGARTRLTHSDSDSDTPSDFVPRSREEGDAVVGPTAPALERILRGPSGLGTAGLYLTRREGPATPGEPETPHGGHAGPRPLPPPCDAAGPGSGGGGQPQDQEVGGRRGPGLPPEWEDQFDGFSVGRYMVACHPDAPTVDHLMIATRLMVAENVLDDCYCEDHGGSPVGLGSRLLLAHTALDPLLTTQEYEHPWAESLQSDAPRRAYRSAMAYFVQQATPSQADRYRHDMARLHLGYLAEAAWSEADHVPEVWEYLAMRQFNNFRPCPTITDTISGYEL